MRSVEVSRTLVKSLPELWGELTAERLRAAVGEVTVQETEPERAIAWHAHGASGTAVLEPSGWGTKLTLTAKVEDEVARLGVWARLRGGKPQPTRHPDIEQRLTGLLDQLGSAHRRPFSRDEA
jgi:hypothetical protein